MDTTRAKLNKRGRVPHGLEGPGITLIIAGIMALGFVGLSGVLTAELPEERQAITLEREGKPAEQQPQTQQQNTPEQEGGQSDDE